MPAQASNGRDRLKRLLGRFIHPHDHGAQEPLLAQLDDPTAADLLSMLEQCIDQDGLLSAPIQAPGHPHLTWPHRGQYYVPNAPAAPKPDDQTNPPPGPFIHPNPAEFLAQNLGHYIKQHLLPLLTTPSESTGSATSHPAPNQPTASPTPSPSHFSLLTSHFPLLTPAASQICALITRSENLRTQLWLKKKFVLETHYCVTLDRVPRALYPEITANQAQRREWVRLYAIDRIEPSLMDPGYSYPLSVAFLEANPHLMLDTRFFDPDFTARLLASFDDLDEALDGLLIQADNFHALALLEPRYRNAIHCIYTDPPYNTGGTDLSYPDRYPRSHWLTLMDNRLRLAHRLLEPGGTCLVSIDENEQARLELLLADIFAPGDFVATFVWETGRKNDSKLVSLSHEYMLCYVKDLAAPAQKGLTWRIRKEGIDEIYAKARSLVRQCKSDYRRASLRLRQWLAGLPDNHPARRHKHYNCIDERGVYHPGNISWPGGGGPRYEVLHPVTHRPCKIPSRGWMYPTPQRMADAVRDNLVHFGPDETRVPCAKVYLHTNEHQAPNSVFYRDGRAAMKRLRHILGADCFCNPKDELLIADRIRLSSPPDASVLDPFAGSGTTAHAVIHLNRADHARRRYILIESGEAFDSILRTRIQRVAYASKWKQGAPQTRDGLTHMFKYLRLESYTDALSNLGAQSPGGRASCPPLEGQQASRPPRRDEHASCPLRDQQAADPPSFPPSPRGGFGGVVEQSSCPPSFHYIQTPDARLTLNPGALADPFNCHLQVVEKDGIVQTTPIDAIETFNHLLGLRVRRIHTDDASGIRSVEGISPTAQRVLIVWRRLTGDAKEDGSIFTTWLHQQHQRAADFDIIYVNGPQPTAVLNENGKRESQQIESVFEDLMFNVSHDA